MRALRPTVRLLASPAASHPFGHGPGPAFDTPLLPPIPLYRRVLRANRKYLQHEMRVLGDQFAAAEFRAHRGTDNPVHVIGFLTEWQTYVQKIEGHAWGSERLDPSKVEKLSDEQYRQLYELMKAIQQRDEEGTK